MHKKAYAVKKLGDSGEGVLVFATLNTIDKDGDVSLNGAFGEQVVPMVAAHDWESVPMGKARIYEADGEARADFALNLGTTLGRNWYNALKFDLDNPPALQNYSFGFSIPTGGSEMGEFDGQRVRFLKRVTVHEVSPVLLGAGVNTRTVELRGRDSRLDQSSVVANVLKTLDRGAKTLSRVQALDVVRQFDELQAKFKAVTSRHWREVHHYDWRLDAALFFSGMAAKELRIDPPRSVKFFRECRYGEPASFTTESGLRGTCRQRERAIWINEQLRGADFIETAAHETRHTAQSPADSEEERDAQEREADIFGKRFASRFQVPPGAAIFVLPKYSDFDADASFHDEAEKGDWLFHPDGHVYEHVDFRWWKKENWKEMIQNVGS